MINQARQKSGVINVYVAIGQKLSKVAALAERLKREGVMDQTIIVATGPSSRNRSSSYCRSSKRVRHSASYDVLFAQ